MVEGEGMMNGKGNRDELLRTFHDAAIAVTREGLSGLTLETAILVDAAIKSGADVCLVYAPSVPAVIGALHPPDPGADPVELFRIEVSPSGLEN
jgi:hypothetical protein